MTEQTVKFHLSNTYRKLGVANRTEASRYAHVNDLTGRGLTAERGSLISVACRTRFSRSPPVDAWRPIPALVGSPGDEPRAERLYRRMRFIRRFEQSLLELFDRGLLNGTTHACIGQEADSIAIAEQLARRRSRLLQPSLPRALPGPARATRSG